MAEIIWKDRKRPFLGLPLSFTKYELTEQKLLINTGLLNVKEEEIRLYRFVDVTMEQSLLQRIFGVGNLHCDTNDRSSGNFVRITESLPGITSGFILMPPGFIVTSAPILSFSSINGHVSFKNIS